MGSAFNSAMRQMLVAANTIPFVDYGQDPDADWPPKRLGNSVMQVALCTSKSATPLIRGRSHVCLSLGCLISHLGTYSSTHVSC
jgi:hypothetical protein